MKDAYTFDRDAAGLDEALRAATARPTTASSTAAGWSGTGCESDVGHDGRHGRPRVHGAVPGGRERRRARARLRRQRRGGHAPTPQPVEPATQPRRAERSRRPALTTIADVARHAWRARAGALLKAFPVVAEERGLLIVFLRGDHRRQRDQARQRARRAVPARARGRVRGRIGPAGFIGPVGADVPHAASTRRWATGRTIVGANRPDLHLRGVEPGRDFASSTPTCARVEAGDTVDGARDPDRARDRDRQHLQARHALLRAAGRDLPGRARRRAADLAWAPTASGRRASLPPRSSSTPTSTGSRGRARSRRGTSTWSALGKAGHAGARRRREALRRAARGSASTSSTTIATRAAARSSPTPSCSAARCG